MKIENIEKMRYIPSKYSLMKKKIEELERALDPKDRDFRFELSVWTSFGTKVTTMQLEDWTEDLNNKAIEILEYHLDSLRLRLGKLEREIKEL